MKIAVNTENTDFLNAFIKIAKDKGCEIVIAKAEQVLFEHIELCDVDAFILSNNFNYFKKATDFIKKTNPYVPVIAIMNNDINNISSSADIFVKMFNPYETFSNTLFFNIEKYIKTFFVLKKLTAKIHDVIEFGNCKYDPTRRLLYHRVKVVSSLQEKGKEPEFVFKEIKKLSQKEGGILELLASNYGEVVKKEIILEKVWRKNDYFAGRSCDVYITYLRNTFKNNKIKHTIKNISGIGLILE